ncbi:hypothetical protein SAMN05216323_100239 [Williamwhitmania taraxaci]|uniref:Uncharacterized protein n=1 Tax=Williamwhitmania taraxaci TaxID=1640674 RepID=A0A1G6GLL1_9BACT|nr:hypothetical protein SAMN05216323_100239 [Williamwhitmania taraxaci]
MTFTCAELNTFLAFISINVLLEVKKCLPTVLVKSNRYPKICCFSI